MIREPYNINPYNSTIDTSKVNNFGFTFSGDELGSWKVEIAKNNTSPDIVYTSKEFVPSDVGYEHIYDSDRVEGITLPSTIAHNQEDDGLLRRLYDIVGYPYNASVVRLAVNDINDLGKIKGCTSDGYLVATTYSLGREDENVTILGYDENGVAVGTQVTNGTYNFLGYLLTVKANTNIQSGQKVQIEGNTFTIGDIEDTQDGYYELMITNGTGSFSGDATVVTFDTLASADLTKLKVKLIPVQDLHGYANPWVGGGGKNMVNFANVSCPNDGTQVQVTLGTMTLPAGTYTLSYTLDKSTTATRNRPMYTPTGSDSVYGNDMTTAGRGSWTFTLTQETEITLKWWYHTIGTACTISDFMLEKGSTATPYAPYSNICPIYPSNGKNLYPDSSVSGSSASLSYYNTIHPSVPIELKADVTYTISFDYVVTADISSAITFSVGVGTGSAYYSDIATFYTANYNGKMVATLTPTSAQLATYKYMSLRFPRWGQVVTNVTWSLNNIQLEYGSVATPYVPYQGINVVHTGKNLLNPSEWESGLLNTSIGSDINSFVSSSRYAHSGICKVGQAKTVTIKTLDPAKINYGAVVAYVDDKVAWTNAVTFTASTTAKTWTLASNTYEKLRINLGAPSGVTADASYVEVQVEQGSTATTYEPYTSTTYPIPLGRDVYGGTLDVTTGKLVVDKAVVDLGSLLWVRYTDIQDKYIYMASVSGMDTTSAKIMSSMFKCRDTWIALDSLAFGEMQSHPSLTYIYARDDNCTTKEAFKSAVSGQQLVYELATPIEYDLTPQQIQTLLGTNNIWSSGNILNVTFSYEES